VRIEFVVLDGEAGKALARRQAAVIRSPAPLGDFQPRPLS
jgi:hypothetical protein